MFIELSLLNNKNVEKIVSGSGEFILYRFVPGQNISSEYKHYT